MPRKSVQQFGCRNTVFLKNQKHPAPPERNIKSPKATSVLTESPGLISFPVSGFTANLCFRKRLKHLGREICKNSHHARTQNHPHSHTHRYHKRQPIPQLNPNHVTFNHPGKPRRQNISRHLNRALKYINQRRLTWRTFKTAPTRPA